MHSHEDITLESGTARRVAIWQAILVVPLALATLIGLVLLWPADSPAGSVPLVADSVTIETGTVTEIGDTDESGATDIRMMLDQGTEVPVHIPPEIIDNGLDVGDSIEVLFTPAAVGTGTPYIFWDFERDVPLWLLIGLYILVVTVVARGKGLAAVAGLGLSLAVVVVFMLPALLAGQNPLLVVLAGAGAMMFSSIYLAHGISIRTTTAILGTAGGLIVTGILAIIATDFANLTGTLTSSALSLTAYDIQLDQLLVCGMILAGLGALNDVTITQVSTVWELRIRQPQCICHATVQAGHGRRTRPYCVHDLHPGVRICGHRPTASDGCGCSRPVVPRYTVNRRDRRGDRSDPRGLDRPRSRHPTHHWNRSEAGACLNLTLET